MLNGIELPLTKIIYIDLSPTASLEQSLRAGAASQAAVLILPPIKLNSQLPSCISFFSRQVYIVKAMVSPVVMYGCESWTIKKADC